MNFYPCKNNDKLNGDLFKPESVSGRVMINPVYPIKKLLADHIDLNALFDSGAFQDITGHRLFHWTALDRQLTMIRRLRFYIKNHYWRAESLFIYDQMAGVDEIVINGKKIKQRGTEETAKKAVEETLQSARYYNSKRDDIYEHSKSLAFVGQGIDPDQYVQCVKDMMQFMRPGDYFGFGGFCIIGRMPKRMMPVFEETFPRVLDLLIPFGITRFHLLGVCYAPAVRFADWEAKIRKVEISNDGSAPELSATTKGVVYRDDGTQDGTVWTKEQKYKEYFPCTLAMDNIKTYTHWASSLPCPTSEQLLQQTGLSKTSAHAAD